MHYPVRIVKLTSGWCGRSVDLSFLSDDVKRTVRSMDFPPSKRRPSAHEGIQAVHYHEPKQITIMPAQAYHPTCRSQPRTE